MSADKTSKTEEAAAPDKKRKPYESPSWEVEKAFAEGGPGTMCAKADVGSCGAGPIQS